MTARRVMSESERRRRLVRRHRLGVAGAGSPIDGDDPVAVTRSVVALHSSDPVSVYLSLLARSPAATIDGVKRVLYQDRDLLRVHGMRRTLWVADRETVADIVAASAARLVRAERRRLSSWLTASGIVDPERWIDEACGEIHRHVIEAGEIDTKAVGEALPHRALEFEVAAGKSYAGTISAHTRILLMLGYEGRIVRSSPRGTWIASQYRWADPGRWVGGPSPFEGRGGGSGAGADRSRPSSCHRTLPAGFRAGHHR